MQLDTAVKNLTNRGFAVRVFKTQQEAVSAISQELSGRTIGFGGSVTLQELGLFEKLSANNTVFWHWKQTPAEACEKAASAQVYMTSANAISETGEIINIDGTGNRVAAMLYGHEVLYIIDPTLGEEGTAALVEKFKAMVEAEGTLASVDEWGKRRLAYPINDMAEGYYVLMNFESKPEFPAELERVMKITEGVMRCLTTAVEA